jgi:hypothetical protein
MADTAADEGQARGWYGPPKSRRWHYIGTDARSLCGKWLVLGWGEQLVGKAFGPANGDCATCKAKLAGAVLGVSRG